MLPTFLRVTLKRLGLLLIAYQLCRLLFLLWNWSMFAEDHAIEIAKSFVYGVRFDVSAMLITNALLIALWFLPVRVLRRPLLQRAELLLFAVINIFFLGLNFIDAEFVKFIGKRSSFELFMMREDIQRQAVSIVGTYWYFPVALCGLVAVLMALTPRFPDVPKERPWWASALWRVAVVGLIVLGIRGGFQFKPLHPMDAYFSTHAELGLLTLNTPFTLIRSQPRGDVNQARYFADEKEPIRNLQAMTDLTRPPLGVARKANVVFIIVESLALEFVGGANTFPGYTPFFDTLIKRPGAYFFRNNFANARRSIEGLPAVICGLPALMEAPILTSDFSNNRFECLPKVLARQGYSTYFLHGAHNGSMHFDTFAKIAGFEHFVGLNEYPKGKPEDFDGYWGVLDEPMLQYAVKTLDEAPKPAMLGLFTLSSHHPYFIPEKYRGQFPKGTLEIHESIGYADRSLKEFFAAAETKPWFKNTIFVITGDHTQKSDHNKDYGLNMLGWYRVPLLIYAPGLAAHPLVVDRERITQHIDAQPSVLDLLGITQENRLLVGQSVFDDKREGRAFNWTGHVYWYADPRVVIEWNADHKALRAWNHNHTWNHQGQEREAQGPEVESALLNLKSVIHYFNEGLILNKLYDWKQAL